MGIEFLEGITLMLAGGIGSLCLMYLRKISITIERQATSIGSIDRRVVRVETMMEAHLDE